METSLPHCDMRAPSRGPESVREPTTGLGRPIGNIIIPSGRPAGPRHRVSPTPGAVGVGNLNTRSGREGRARVGGAPSWYHAAVGGVHSGGVVVGAVASGRVRLVGCVAVVGGERGKRRRPARRDSRRVLGRRVQGAVLGEATRLVVSDVVVRRGDPPALIFALIDAGFVSAPRQPSRPVVGMTIKPHSRDVDAPAEFGHSTHDVTASSHTYEGMATRLGAAYTRDRRPPHGLPQTHVPKCGHPADSNGFRRSQRHDFSLPDHGRRPSDAPKSAASVGTRGAPKDGRLPTLWARRSPIVALDII